MKSESGYEKRKRNSVIYYFPGLMLLSMMLVVPQAYQEIKAVLLLIVFAEVFAIFTMTERNYLHPKIFCLFIFYIFLGLMYGIYGLFRGNPGAVPVTKEVALYVMFYMILVSGVRNHNSLKYVHKTLVFSTCFMTVYMIATYLHVKGILPDWLYYDLSAETAGQEVFAGGLGVTGKFEMTFSSYCNLMFLQPYLFFHLLLSKGKASKSLWFAVISSTIFMIFSSSRALLVIALVFPLVIISGTIISGAIDLKIRKIIFRGILIIFTLILLLILSLTYFKQYGFSVPKVYADLMGGFASYEIRPSGDVIENPRIGQTLALINGWKEKPFFGFGSGAVYWGYLRSETSPWAYEVSFAYFFYQWGIVGCLLYATGLYYIYRTSFRAYKAKSELGIYALAAAYGSVAFLTGSWTNPYLLRFDSLFVIFIPIAVVNLYLFEKDHIRRSSGHPVEVRSDSY